MLFHLLLNTLVSFLNDIVFGDVVIVVFVIADVSPHLVFKNGMTPTLWPQDMPFPPDEGKEEVASTFGDDSTTQQPGDRNCFSPNSMQYPAYFKDSKGKLKKSFLFNK